MHKNKIEIEGMGVGHKYDTLNHSLSSNVMKIVKKNPYYKEKKDSINMNNNNFIINTKDVDKNNVNTFFIKDININNS